MKNELHENNRNIQFDIVAMILSFMVVMIHSSYTAFYNTEKWVSTLLDQYYSDYISGFAVPTFFIISAIKFYRNYDYSKTFSKWKSRVYSLLIPYLCWNFLSVVWAILFSYAPVISDLVATREKFVFSVDNIIGGLFWFKYLHPFWYLALLMLFTLLCPIIYALIKNRHIGIISIFVLYLLDAFTVEFPATTWPMFQIRTIIYCSAFYLIGAMLGKYKYDMVCMRWDKKYSVLAIFLFFVAVLLRGLTNNSHMIFIPAILLGALAIWIFVSGMNIKDSALIKVSFFIYPAHTFILPCVNKLLYFVLPNNSVMCILNTVGGTVITYGICIVLALIARKILPVNIWKMLNGNRV